MISVIKYLLSLFKRKPKPKPKLGQLTKKQITAIVKGGHLPAGFARKIMHSKVGESVVWEVNGIKFTARVCSLDGTTRSIQDILMNP